MSLVKTLFISTSSLSHGDKAWPIFALGGLAIWPRRISKKRTGETGTLNLAKIGTKISKRATLWIPDSLSMALKFRILIVTGIPDSLCWIMASKARDPGFEKLKFSWLPESILPNISSQTQSYDPGVLRHGWFLLQGSTLEVRSLISVQLKHLQCILADNYGDKNLPTWGMKTS